MQECLQDEVRFEFEGVGFALTRKAVRRRDEDYTFTVEMVIDGGIAEKIELSTDSLTRRNSPFWKYRLAQKKHSVLLKVLNPTEETEIELHDLIIYGDKPLSPTH